MIRGCVPKKLLVYASHYAEEFKDAEGFGWAPIPREAVRHDWPKLIANKNAEISRLNGIYRRLIEGAGAFSEELRVHSRDGVHFRRAPFTGSLRRLYGAASGQVLVSSSRELLSTGPDGLADAIARQTEEVAACLA